MKKLKLWKPRVSYEINDGDRLEKWRINYLTPKEWQGWLFQVKEDSLLAFFLGASPEGIAGAQAVMPEFGQKVIKCKNSEGEEFKN